MPTARRGFFIAEGITAIALLAVAGVLLLVGITRHGLATSRLADDRRAVRMAEATLARLQAHQVEATPTAGIQIRALPDPAPVGTHWTEVTASSGDQTRSLVGLVPDASPKTTPAEVRDK